MKEKRWGREETLSKVVFGEREGAEGKETLKKTCLVKEKTRRDLNKDVIGKSGDVERRETLRKMLLVKEKSWRIVNKDIENMVFMIKIGHVPH